MSRRGQKEAMSDILATGHKTAMPVSSFLNCGLGVGASARALVELLVPLLQEGFIQTLRQQKWGRGRKNVTYLGNRT